MFQGADDLLAYIADEGVENVDVRFCDLPGIMQHFTVPAGSFGPEVFEEGLAFDGSSVTGFQTIHESDMSLLPDPTTAYLDPFRKAKTLVVNFFVHDPLTKEPYSRDPATSRARRKPAWAPPASVIPPSSHRRPSSTSSTTCATRPTATARSTRWTPRQRAGTPLVRRTGGTSATR